jgi:hypothetical protein
MLVVASFTSCDDPPRLNSTSSAGPYIIIVIMPPSRTAAFPSMLASPIIRLPAPTLDLRQRNSMIALRLDICPLILLDIRAHSAPAY